MTKVITIPEFQIDDVVWTENHLFAYYSRPGDTEACEHQFISVPLASFYEYLEDNDHLIVDMPSPYLTEQGFENDPMPSFLMPEEFRLLDNSHTWPIIKSYLELYHRPDAFSSTAVAINNIMSHFNPSNSCPGTATS